jgi:hypothetical protein
MDCEQLRMCLNLPDFSQPNELDICTEPCIQEILRAVRSIEDELLGNSFVTLENPDCDGERNPEVLFGNKFNVLYDAIIALHRFEAERAERICDINPVAVIPEWWQVRPGANRPQLVVLVKSTEGNSYWSFSIPHYNRGDDFKPTIPRWTKGSHFACLTLNDNSKLWINASSQSEAEGVIRQLLTYIDPAQLPQPLQIHTGERKGQALRVATVKPVRGLFYSQGQRNMIPDWEIRLDTEDEEEQEQG